MRVQWGLWRWSQCLSFRSQPLIKRTARLYTSTSREDVQEYVVTCGSSGVITVDLHNPIALLSPTAPLILYLPPHPSHITTTNPSIPSFLAETSHAIARINYRWNYVPPPPQFLNSSPSPRQFSTHPSYRKHPFPTPLHDTLHAFTYLTTHLLPRFSPPPKNTTTSPPPGPKTSSYAPYIKPKPPPQRPLIIYGSKLGGTLATTLALTECSTSKSIPFPITSLIARDAVYDWTGVATTRDPNLLHPASSLVDDGWAAKLWDSTRSWDTQTLHALKTRLFAHPSSPFDAFASPILFFRTAGLSIPSTWLGSSTSTSDRDSLSNNTGNNEGKAGKDKEEEIEISRKSNLKFPPKDSGLRIPRSLFLTSKAEDGDGELARQAEEMVKVMRRSVVLHEFKERVLWDEDVDAHQASEDRVRVYEISGGKEEGTVARNWLDF